MSDNFEIALRRAPDAGGDAASACALVGLHVAQGMERLAPGPPSRQVGHPIRLLAGAHGPGDGGAA